MSLYVEYQFSNLNFTRTESDKIVKQFVLIGLSHEEFVTAVCKAHCEHASHEVHPKNVISSGVNSVIDCVLKQGPLYVQSIQGT